jgi:DNA-directed RNA polymerase specialized sigma24 family protein
MNLLRNYRRHSANRSDNRAHPSELEACVAPNDREQIDDERTRRLIAELLEPLTQRNQELIRRFYLEEEDKTALSEDLGIPVPQLRLRLWRAKRQMKEVCTAKGWDPQDLL